MKRVGRRGREGLGGREENLDEKRGRKDGRTHGQTKGGLRKR